MRPIDGDALLEKQYDVDYYSEYSDERLVVDVEDIKNAPTIEPYGTWIPCSERLPGKYELCLITQKIGTQKLRRVAIRLLGEWVFNGRRIKDEAVIAWMHLPEPFREEKK